MWRDYEDNSELVNVLKYTSAFTSDVSKTSDAGLEKARVNGLIRDSLNAVFLVTAINATTGIITAIRLSN